MTTRREVLLALGALAALPAYTLQPGNVWRIGYLDYGSRQATIDVGGHAGPMQGLRNFGYVEGSNFAFEARYADGRIDRVDTIAAELVGQKPDLIRTAGAPSLRSSGSSA